MSADWLSRRLRRGYHVLCPGGSAVEHSAGPRQREPVQAEVAGVAPGEDQEDRDDGVRGVHARGSGEQGRFALSARISQLTGAPSWPAGWSAGRCLHAPAC